jgi:anti-sigma factor RsiW
MNHVVDDLSALLDGQLEAPQRQRMEEHLASCASCAAQKARLELVLAAVGRVEPVEPSPQLRRQVLAAVDRQGGVLERLRALWSVRFLVPVASAAAAAVGLFALTRAGVRQQLPQAEELELAQNAEMLEDYELLASAARFGLSPADLEVVAHLDELEN